MHIPSPRAFASLALPLILMPFLGAADTAAGEPPPVSFGVEAGGGFAGLEQADFVKAADDNAGTVEPAGWTGGGRVLVQLSMGLGISAGWVTEGGGRYGNSITGFNKKKGTSITRTIVASYEQTVYPLSVHYRKTLDRLSLGVEAGVSLTSGTVHYAEIDSLGDSLRGDLRDEGIGYHAAAEGALRLGERLSVYLRLGYSALTLGNFTGTVDENGTLKPESLFMVRESGSDREQLEVSTSSSLTSSDHRPANVSGAGIRFTAGLRWMF